jgi:ABC-2 type transport system ATP-binding protein
MFQDKVIQQSFLVNEAEPEIVVNAKSIVKRFGSKSVLNYLDFVLPKGQIYAICGNNGSGKSVFLRIIAGLILPDSGIVEVFGNRIGKDLEFPDRTGALIDHPGFLLTDSGFRNLELLAMISGNVSKEKIADTMAFVGLDANDRKPVRTYSVGMRQRLGLAQALMEDPDLIILDEPTAGLDFDAQREIYEYMITLRKMGKTLLITSHYLNEVKLLCDRAFILKDGRLSSMQDINSETAYK